MKNVGSEKGSRVMYKEIHIMTMFFCTTNLTELFKMCGTASSNFCSFNLSNDLE